MPAEASMSRKDRKRLIIALVIAPLIIAVPVLSPHFGQAGFLHRNLDVLLIFVVVPYCAALWLYLRGWPRRR
jgi:hypothetical protein